MLQEKTTWQKVALLQRKRNARGCKVANMAKTTRKNKPAVKRTRKSAYNKATAMEVICALIARGKSLVQITSSDIPGIPKYEAVMKWLREDDQTDDKIYVKMYARAREDAADFLADEIIAIADDSSDDELFTDEGKRICNAEFIQRSRLRVDARKWVAAKLKPRKYGEKIELDNKHSGTVAVAPELTLVLNGGKDEA